jgi:hypothetical protein
MCKPHQTYEKDPEDNCKYCRDSIQSCTAEVFAGRYTGTKDGCVDNYLYGRSYDPTRVTTCYFPDEPSGYKVKDCYGCKSSNPQYRKYSAICNNNCYDPSEYQCCASNDLCSLKDDQECCTTGFISEGIKSYGCVDKRNDEYSCGKCGNICMFGQQCCNSACGEPRPDLSVSSIQFESESITKGSVQKVTAVINRTDEFFSSAITTNNVKAVILLDNLTKDEKIFSISPNSKVSVNFSVAFNLEPGQHTLKIILDSDKTINECDRRKNEFTKTITIYNKTDLVADSFVIGCTKNEQCDDNNLCTADRCKNNTCQHKNNDTANRKCCNGTLHNEAGMCCREKWYLGDQRCCVDGDCLLGKTCNFISFRAEPNTCVDRCPSSVCYGDYTRSLCCDGENNCKNSLNICFELRTVNGRKCGYYRSTDKSKCPKTCDQVTGSCTLNPYSPTYKFYDSDASSAKAGEIIPLLLKIKNIGPTNATNFLVSILENSILYNNFRTTLASMKSNSSTINWTVKDNALLEFDVDSTNIISETNETNNNLTKKYVNYFPPTPPEIVVPIPEPRPPIIITPIDPVINTTPPPASPGTPQAVEGISGFLHTSSYGLYTNSLSAPIIGYFNLGTDYIEWKSGLIPSNYTTGNLTFVWMGSLNYPERKMKLSLNGIETVQFSSNVTTDTTWTNGNNELFFSRRQGGVNKEGIFYLTVPASMVAANSKATLRLDNINTTDYGKMVYNLTDTLAAQTSLGTLSTSHIGKSS